MKLLRLFLLVLSPLCAQTEIGKLYVVEVGIKAVSYGPVTVYIDVSLAYKVTRTGVNTKNFQFVLQDCYSPIPNFDNLTLGVTGGHCNDEPAPTAQEDYGSVVNPELSAFKNAYPKATFTTSYGPFAQTPVDGLHANLTSPLPAVQPDPYLLYLDGTGNSLMQVDLSTFAIMRQVVVPSTSGPFGVRPTSTGDGNEVWVINPGAGVTIVDLAAQSVLANIPTPSIPASANAAGIVFTNSGATALEAVAYSSPDSSGNNGALFVFDAANRKVTSTLPLKYGPTTFLMAPDGLTAYLLSGSGELTYYDVLSGTADLSLSTYTPGLAGGYPGSGSQAFIHPDGTRLFWNVGVYLEVFDITTHKLINSFNTGLPTTYATSMTMAQDGSVVYVSNGNGDVATVETRYGNIVTAYQVGPPGAQVFGGPPLN